MKAGKLITNDLDRCRKRWMRLANPYHAGRETECLAAGSPEELQESRDSEARLRKIIDTIPALAWCQLVGWLHDFVNQRWSDYTGLFKKR